MREKKNEKNFEIHLEIFTTILEGEIVEIPCTIFLRTKFFTIFHRPKFITIPLWLNVHKLDC